MPTFDQLVNSLVKGEEDIKDYHFMVEWFKTIGSDYYNFEAEEGLDDNEKWKKISDMFRGFGYSRKKFSSTKCRDRFFQWSSFYAKNYDELNGKISPKFQEIFDLLKIVHILDFTIVWSPINRTHLKLKEISNRREIKEYLTDYQKKEHLSRVEIEKLSGNGPAFNDDNKVFATFEEMNLSDDLLRGIRALRYTNPSHIQKRAIVPCIKGMDVIAQAQSGTGKTAAFSIAILQRIDTSINECQALILAPTRELAQQIHKELAALGKYMSIRSHLSIGGTFASEDSDELEKGFPIVVGTPGRVLHMIKEEHLCTDYIKIFVLDEADQLLDLNGMFTFKNKKAPQRFKHQIFDVFRALKPNIQVFLSSATMPKDILKMTHSFMKNQRIPILVKDEELTLEGLKQFYVETEYDGNKFDIFLDLYQRIFENKEINSRNIQAFVYVNTKHRVDLLIQKLESRGIGLAYMHGETDQKSREWTLNDFRKGYTHVLITTDLLGRGIDVKEVELVINYDLPQIKETYMHRVGRSGRFGRTGKAITLVTTVEKESLLSDIEKFYNTEIRHLPGDFSNLF